MSNETKTNERTGDTMNALVICSCEMCTCKFEDGKRCMYKGKCEHQITDEEIYESIKAYKEAAKIQ